MSTEQRWNDTDRGKVSAGRKLCTSATSSTKKKSPRKWPGIKLAPQHWEIVDEGSELWHGLQGGENGTSDSAVARPSGWEDGTSAETWHGLQGGENGTSAWAVTHPSGWREWHFSLSRVSLQDGEDGTSAESWHGLQDGENGTSAWAVARPSGWIEWHISFALLKLRIQILTLWRTICFRFAALKTEAIVMPSDTQRCVVMWLKPDVS